WRPEWCRLRQFSVRRQLRGLEKVEGRKLRERAGSDACSPPIENLLWILSRKFGEKAEFLNCIFPRCDLRGSFARFAVLNFGGPRPRKNLKPQSTLRKPAKGAKKIPAYLRTIGSGCFWVSCSDHPGKVVSPVISLAPRS